MSSDGHSEIEGNTLEIKRSVNSCRKMVRSDTERGKKENTAKVRKRRQFLRHLIRCDYKRSRKKGQIGLNEQKEPDCGLSHWVKVLKAEKCGGILKNQLQMRHCRLSTQLTILLQ